MTMSVIMPWTAYDTPPTPLVGATSVSKTFPPSFLSRVSIRSLSTLVCIQPVSISMLMGTMAGVNNN